MVNTFDKFANDQFERLDLYTTVIVRAHGDKHPEFRDIRSSFEKIQEKYRKITDLTSEYQTLREVTNDYTVPADTCETTESTFDLLKKSDELYSKA